MKQVTICISGSIAAHKVPLIVDKLSRHDLDLFIAMTKSSQAFVSPLTLEVLSKRSIIKDVIESQLIAPVDHIFLAQKSDLVVIVPATANTIGKIANGLADDIVSSICMVIPKKIPKLIVPAMNQEMYVQDILQENLSKLKSRNYIEIPPQVDLLASGDIGIGALADSDIIVSEILKILELA
ncbi:putative phosphopantothenoylcysteine decarboxylase [Carnobacterium maltaromaticum]|uniref:flavoprotein n=1 Tax=Carnobacterium maltaromaticum TaxID=2751 RepID=UPI00191BBBF9|nr:flavoprotein [Carnobacterium maltaromaticum]CAD5901909.1 putative phosphopantothenoylcysteine decarboxylase [Carnobacterium maltaromaticum]